LPVPIIPTIPYSAQYNMMNREGHECPPPTFGAPTLVWHLGISPHEEDEKLEQVSSLCRLLRRFYPPAVEHLAQKHAKLAEKYDRTRRDFFRDINVLLFGFHDPLAHPRGALVPFRPDRVPRPWTEDEWTQGNPFRVTDPENIRFTLWWPDQLPLMHAQPQIDALRIKVHATAYRDYVTISIYLDAGKPWNQPAYLRGQRVQGRRRQAIFDEVQTIYDLCEARLGGSQGARPLVQEEILPEGSLSPTDAAALMRASRYLYSEVWDEFWDALQLPPLDQIIGRTGRVFANFRGLVLSTPGFDPIAQLPTSPGDTPFPRFAGNGGLNDRGTGSSTEPNESNAVVKAFWPFIRRITPNADQREYIACGVMNWRALYITALSSARAFDWQEEAESAATDLPAGFLPEDLIDRVRGLEGEEVRLFDSQSGKAGEGPIRYLVLSKGEPHRRQIGRIVDRINAMGSMRLIALRDWTIIRDASTQIQLRGQELDTIMQRWSEKSTEIRDEHPDRWLWRNRRRDRRDEKLQALATEVERDLIYLSAALDTVGKEARNGFHFRINRSRFYAAEFMSLLGTLKIGNIDTWVAYDQFVTRGLKPAFDFIDGVGERLVGLRTRLQSVLEGIETSALVIQTSATRSNTAQLRRVANRFRLQNLLIVLVGYLVAYKPDAGTWLEIKSFMVFALVWLRDWAWAYGGL
jgi:hypothetical protein